MFLFAQIYCGYVLCILNIKEITNVNLMRIGPCIILIVE